MSASYKEVFERDNHVEEAVDSLVRFAKDELKGDEHEKLERHLGDCPACRLELIQLRKAVEHELALWSQAQSIVGRFIGRRLPGEARYVDSVWALLEARGLLGTLPDLSVPEAAPSELREEAVGDRRRFIACGRWRCQRRARPRRCGESGS